MVHWVGFCDSVRPEDTFTNDIVEITCKRCNAHPLIVLARSDWRQR